MFWGAIPLVPFKLFGLQHLIVMFIIICTALIIYFYRERIKNLKYEKYIRLAIAVLLIFQTIIYQIWLISCGMWSIKSSLPLSMCEFTAFISVYMLISKSRKIFDITFFTGVIVSSVAVLTPNIVFGYPHVRFIEYFMEHGLIIIAPLYMLFIHGFKPGHKALRRLVIIVNCCIPVIAVINFFTKGNYWFLSNIPETTSYLNFLGPHPVYIFTAELLGVLVFYIFTLPFRQRKHEVELLD